MWKKMDLLLEDNQIGAKPASRANEALCYPVSRVSRHVLSGLVGGVVVPDRLVADGR